MHYDFTVKALSIPALSASNKVLQAIKRPGDQLFSYWCCQRFPFDASRQKPPCWVPARSSLVPLLGSGVWSELQGWAWPGTGDGTHWRGECSQVGRNPGYIYTKNNSCSLSTACCPLGFSLQRVAVCLVPKARGWCLPQVAQQELLQVYNDTGDRGTPTSYPK